MKSRTSPRRSIKTRVTLFTLCIFLISLWSLAFYASQMLREDLQGLVTDQQLSTASAIAAEVDQGLSERLNGLEAIARAIQPGMLDRPAALQKFLDSRANRHSQFNAGVMAYRRDGVAIADVPRSPARIGVSYLDVDSVAAAVQQGKSTIGRPIVGKTLRAPLFPMAVPIRDTHGKVIGALAGATSLSQANFLDKITEHRYGKTGGYLLVAPQYRLIVTATDKSRAMEVLAAAGSYPLFDRFIQGYRGSGVETNPQGVEMLVSAKDIPSAGWLIVAELPAAEAFAPIHAMQRRMLLATLWLTLLAAVLSWWMLQRELSPLFAAVKTLASLLDGQQSPQPLPIARADEIGELIGGFNRVLETLAQREEALKASQAFMRTILDSVAPSIAVVDRAGTIIAVNAPWRRFALENGSEPGQPAPNTDVGTNYFAICRMPTGIAALGEFDAHIGMAAVLDGRSASFSLEYPCHSPTQQRWFMMNVLPLGQDSRDGVVITHTDITATRNAEVELRIAAVAFESREAMMVTDADSVILRVNRAFTEITGFTAQEVVGQTPKLFQSGRHDADFYRSMWQTIERTGTWQGEVWDRRKNGEVYPKWLIISAVKDAAGAVTHYIGTHHDISERKQAEEKIKLLAFFDPLTGLPNRTLLLDRLQRAMTVSARSGSYGALLFIDLDKFKTLNDTHGHDMGDLLLQQVGQRLCACVRAGDTVARIGGDEFVVKLASLSGSQRDAAKQTEVVGEKILAALNEAYQLDTVRYHSTPSIGATLFSGQGTGIEDLLKQADLAMYKAKESGRNALRFFDPAMEVVVMQRAVLEKELREAVAKKQFVLHYQAQVAGDQLTGAEVLLRWQHPQRGMVSPAEFIPLAEEIGLILPLGHWVLQTACAQLALWSAGAATADLTISVNVSARQIRQVDFVAQVLEVIESSGADPRRLKLELTESLLVANIDDIIGKMAALKAEGVGFALDDFGTGYSSLAYLKRLPLDQLKIDQSFVRDVLTDPNDAAIARTIIALAQSLGLGVIAEGVETLAQRDFLASNGCRAYQGYLFSRPLPVADFEALVAHSAAESNARSRFDRSSR